MFNDRTTHQGMRLEELRHTACTSNVDKPIGALSTDTEGGGGVMAAQHCLTIDMYEVLCSGTCCCPCQEVIATGGAHCCRTFHFL